MENLKKGLCWRAICSRTWWLIGVCIVEALYPISYLIRPYRKISWSLGAADWIFFQFETDISTAMLVRYLSNIATIVNTNSLFWGFTGFITRRLIANCHPLQGFIFQWSTIDDTYINWYIMSINSTSPRYIAIGIGSLQTDLTLVTYLHLLR